jgi:muconolactone delta-isomerase
MPKFLILADVTSNLPPYDAMQQATDAALSWLQEQQRNNKIEVAYTYPEGGGCAIFNTDSVEEVQELLSRNPATAFLRYTVRPLIDFDQSMNRLVQARQGGDTW